MVFIVLGVILALVPLPLLAVPLENPGRGFIIPLTQQRTSSPVTHSGAIDPYGSNADLGKRAPNTAIALLDSRTDLTWQAKVTIGPSGPTHVFDLAVDTGSSDLLVAGPRCLAAKQKKKRIYKPPRKQQALRTFTAGFSDGSMTQGKVFQDRVSIGGLTATNQAIAVADKMSGKLTEDFFTADGILGLGRLKDSRTRQLPFLQTLAAQGAINTVVFGVLMRKGQGCYSELSLGFANEKMYKKETLSFAPVVDSGWTVKMSIAVNGKQVFASVNAVIDTGSTFVIGDRAGVAKIYEAIDQAKEMPDRPGYYSVPCKGNPPITLKFGDSDRSFDMKPPHFLWDVGQAPDRCFGTIVSADDISDTWEVGGAFLHGVYAIFKEQDEGHAPHDRPPSPDLPADPTDVVGPAIGFAEVADEVFCQG